METAVTPERKVEKWFPRWEINRINRIMYYVLLCIILLCIIALCIFSVGVCQNSIHPLIFPLLFFYRPQLFMLLGQAGRCRHTLWVVASQRPHRQHELMLISNAQSLLKQLCFCVLVWSFAGS